jgi:hypothetical protein
LKEDIREKVTNRPQSRKDGHADDGFLPVQDGDASAASPNN